MTTPIEQMSFIPGPLGTTKTSLAEYTGRVVYAKDYGAVGNGIANDTLALRKAICAAFGIACFVGGNGASSSTTLNVTSINYGTIGAGTSVYGVCSAQFTGSVSGTNLTVISDLSGVIAVGQNVAGPGITPGTVVIVSGSGTSWVINTPLSISASPFNMSTRGIQAGTIMPGGAGGGVGLYTLNQANVIANGTLLYCTNGQGNPFANKILDLQGGNYVITEPLALVGISGGLIRGRGAQIFAEFSTYGNTLSSEIPTATPVFMLEGVGYSKIEGLSFGSIDPSYVAKVATANTLAASFTGTISGTALTVSGGTVTGTIAIGQTIFSNTNGIMVGTVITGGSGLSWTVSPSHATSVGPAAMTSAGTVLTVTDTTGIIPGMLAENMSNANAVGGTVTATTSTTVTLSGVTSGIGTVANDSIVFVSSTIAIYAYQSGIAGYTGGLFLEDVGFQKFGIGFLGGSGPGNCDNMTFLNVQMTNCALSGIRANSFNAVNWQVYGGGAANCGSASTLDPIYKVLSGNLGAAYSCTSGQISVIMNVSCTGNLWDLCNAGTQGCTMIGGRCEGGGIKPFVASFTCGTGGVSSTNLTVTAITGRLYPGNWVEGTGIAGQTWITSQTSGTPNGVGVYTMSSAQAIPNGTVLSSSGQTTAQSLAIMGSTQVIGNIFGGAVPGVFSDLIPAESCRALDLTFSGQATLDGYIFGQNSAANGVFAALGNNGILITQDLQFANHADHGLLTGGANARVYFKSASFVLGQSSNFFTNFTGKICEYSPIPELTVATLPTANARWSRAVVTVTDSNLAWSTANFGASLTGHGGGTHEVPARCPDGGGWVIGG